MQPQDETREAAEARKRELENGAWTAAANDVSHYNVTFLGPGAAALKAFRAALSIRHNNKARRKLYELAKELCRLRDEASGEAPLPHRTRF